MNTYVNKAQKDKKQSASNAVSQKKSNNKSTFHFEDNRPETVAQRKLQEIADNSPRTYQLMTFQKMTDHSDQEIEEEEEIVQGKFISTPITSSSFSPSIIQLDKGKIARETEVEQILKKGNKKISSFIGLVRPYLGDDEENFIFLVGLIGGGFGFKSLGSFLTTINSTEANQTNTLLQSDITEAFDKVIGFKEAFTAIVGSQIAEFREGRTAEFQGLAGELSAAAQLIEAGKSITRLGAVLPYGDKQSQEVDLVANDGDDSYFIEVAATPSKLRDKISGGIKKTYPQMQGYKDLAKENKEFQVAYSCPTLTVSQISDEFIEKIAKANVLLVVKGKFYDASELKKLVDEHEKHVTKPREKTTKSHKQTKHNHRGARLKDRGTKPSGKDLLSGAMMDYQDDLASEEADLKAYNKGYSRGYNLGYKDGDYDGYKNEDDYEFSIKKYKLNPEDKPYDKGILDGYEEGYNDGYEEGESFREMDNSSDDE